MPGTLIYIPIWLDLLLMLLICNHLYYRNLHSNMVRFIIRRIFWRECNRFVIYIPIWLDLLSTSLPKQVLGEPNLHSNMVRFIMLAQKHRRVLEI